MPALKDLFRQDNTPGGEGLPTLSVRGVSGERIAAMLPMPGACSCGSSLPMQVRLHLRSRTRPVFEGRWCCSASCLETRVAAAVRRESWKGVPQAPHRHRVPLGLLLLSSGAVTHDMLRFALEMQHRTGERIGDILQRECGLSERKLTEALAKQWGCAVWDISGIDAAAMALVAPHVVLQTSGMLPIRLEQDGGMAMAFAQSVDAQALLAIQRIHGSRVDCGMISTTQWEEARRRVLACPGVPVEEIVCRGMEELERAVVRTIQLLQPVESRSARVREWYWLRVWLEPAALAMGSTAQEDVMDFVFRVGSASNT